MPFKCVATDLITGKSVVLQGDADVAKSVSASSSIPGVFKPVKLDEYLLVDGGITCRVPVNTVRKMGAKVVVAVDVLGKIRPNDKNYNMFSLLLRSFDICDSELVKYKLGRQRPDLYLEPELGNMSQYKFKDIALAIEKGYELGKANAPKIKELIK
jgi:NTE family protein